MGPGQPPDSEVWCLRENCRLSNEICPYSHTNGVRRKCRLLHVPGEGRAEPDWRAGPGSGGGGSRLPRRLALLCEIDWYWAPREPTRVAAGTDPDVELCCEVASGGRNGLRSGASPTQRAGAPGGLA